ncbi:hypothetical protein D3C76_1444690 [compost metagenome]
MCQYKLTISNGAMSFGVYQTLPFITDIVQKINHCLNAITNIWAMLNELIAVGVFFKCFVIAIN